MKSEDTEVSTTNEMSNEDKGDDYDVKEEEKDKEEKSRNQSRSTSPFRFSHYKEFQASLIQFCFGSV